MRRAYTTNAYLTVLVSLVITTLISLILALFQGAGIGAAALRAESATEVALESGLAEYHKALFDRYGLLMIDLSYGEDGGTVSNLASHLEVYASKNLENSLLGKAEGGAGLVGVQLKEILIPEYLLCCDGDGAIFRRQILAYMRAEPVSDYLAQTMSNITVLKSNGYDTMDVEAEYRANQELVDNLYEENELDKDDLPAGIEQANALRAYGALLISHPNASGVSRAGVDLNTCVSHRQKAQGAGSIPGENLSVADIGLIDRYIFEKCSSWSNQREDAYLKYQIEYLIAGAANDYDNLETIATILLAWREASNYVCILTDSEKKAIAKTIGLGTAIITLQPLAYPIIKHSILLAWSFLESVADVKALFKGGKVPLVKTPSAWQTNVFSLSSSEGCTTGLDYNGYLSMLLFMTDIKQVSLRLMDVMEVDIRQLPGNDNFRMDLCLDSFKAQFSYDSSVGWSGVYTRERGYESKYPEGTF